MTRELGSIGSCVPPIYKLKVKAPKAEIDIDDLHCDFEMARREYESWLYDPKVMETHGYVSLEEMRVDPYSDEPSKYKVSRSLGEHKW